MKISQAKNDDAPIVLIYGGEGRGKTTLAAKFPRPVALLLERGLPRGVTIDAIEDVCSYDTVMAAMRELYLNPQGYQTLVIDTVDSLEPMLLAHVCAANGWKNIEAPSYGKGWVLADAEWIRFITAIRALRDKHGMTIVLVAHSTIERFDDPRAPSYTSYWPKLHKRARHLILDACDVVGFLAEELRIAVAGACVGNLLPRRSQYRHARGLKPASIDSWRCVKPRAALNWRPRTMFMIKTAIVFSIRQ